MDDFVISGSYQGYTFVGCALGRFEAKAEEGRTEMKDYFSMYVVSPVSSYKSEDYSAFGFKSEKMRCIGPDVWKDLKPGDRVRLFFDDKKRVVMTALDE